MSRNDFGTGVISERQHRWYVSNIALEMNKGPTILRPTVPYGAVWQPFFLKNLGYVFGAISRIDCSCRTSRDIRPMRRKTAGRHTLSRLPLVYRLCESLKESESGNSPVGAGHIMFAAILISLLSDTWHVELNLSINNFFAFYFITLTPASARSRNFGCVEIAKAVPAARIKRSRVQFPHRALADHVHLGTRQIFFKQSTLKNVSQVVLMNISHWRRPFFHAIYHPYDALHSTCCRSTPSAIHTNVHQNVTNAIQSSFSHSPPAVVPTVQHLPNHHFNIVLSINDSCASWGEMEEKLNEIFLDPKIGYVGVERLFEKVKGANREEINEWLEKQPPYT
uniref:Uncharacterized protein n=1 Tax=Romanomermis culicivorax TaxID=13658 RepID=A0A915IQU3_ROMCU